MEVSCQLHASAALTSGGRARGTHWTELSGIICHVKSHRSPLHGLQNER